MESLVQHPNRINQPVSGMMRKPIFNFSGLRYANGQQPMDIDSFDIIDNAVDAYGYKTIDAAPFTKGELITSFTMTCFQQYFARDGLYVQVLHDTKPWETVDDEKAYVWRVWEDVSLIAEYAYGEKTVASFRAERGAKMPMVKADYCFQAKHGGFLLGVYPMDDKEVAQLKRVVDILNEVSLPSILMILSETALESNEQILTKNVVVKEAYHNGHRMVSSGETVLAMQETFRAYSPLRTEKRMFNNIKDLILARYNSGVFS